MVWGKCGRTMKEAVASRSVAGREKRGKDFGGWSVREGGSERSMGKGETERGWRVREGGAVVDRRGILEQHRQGDSMRWRVGRVARGDCGGEVWHPGRR